MRPQTLQPLRVFLAIELDNTMKTVFTKLIDTLKKTREGKYVRWTPIPHLHMTLRFIGNVSPTRIDQIVEQVQKIVRGTPPFRIQFDKVMLFPSQLKPQVIAVDIKYSQILQDLFQNIENAITQLGFTPELRPQRAHVTIGRFKKDYIPSIDMNLSHHNLTMMVDHVVLFESVRNEKQIQYNSLRTIDLNT